MIPHLAMAVMLATATGAPQSIGDGELQRMIYRGAFPIGCQDAQLAANRMRAKPTTDPATLRGFAQTFRACADSSYGLHANALANLSNFSAAAALLLAARYEPTPQGAADARTARALSQKVIDYRHTPNAAGGRSNGADPSPLITDAGRINRDAVALARYDAPPDR